MEAFAPLPVDLFADPNNLLDDETSNYFSLSQFDLELQQQAQAALLEQNSWQDFDKYLPIDNQLFFNNTTKNGQAQPIFSQNIAAINTSSFQHQNNPTLLYEPLAGLLPSQKPPAYDNSQQWDSIKREYTSPNSLPYSPPLAKQQQQQHVASTTSTSTSTSTSTTTTTTNMPAFQNQPATAATAAASSTTTSSMTEDKESPKKSSLTIPAIDFMNWSSPSMNTPLDSAQAKVPIQRLKSNNIINNAVNAALNNTQAPVGRQHKKTAHNAIERRYRNNINDRIAELKNAVPALLHAKVKDSRTTGTGAKRSNDDEEEAEDGQEFLDGVAVATKLNKATILKKATEYINYLKKQGDDVRHENQALQHILTRLPGGQDILQRYHVQKQQREKEIQQQQLMEREVQKQQDQLRKAANRKRARHNNAQQQQQQQHHHEASDEYESSSSSPGSLDPVTPPAITNRVFMALFMCITFFSTSPLTTGPSSSEQYQNHHHTSRANVAESDAVSQNVGSTDASSSPDSFLGSLFKFDDTWSCLRTIVFIICIVQLFFPYIRSLQIGPSLKLKRVNKSKRNITPSSRREVIKNTATPGELKCKKMYAILEKSIRYSQHAGDEHVPTSTLATIVPLLKESARLFSHHILGYDIMYGKREDGTPGEEWGQVCKWIKLNETKCVGGAFNSSRLSMLYSCLRMINLVDALDALDQDTNHIFYRAYATAAMQMSLIIPRRSIAEKVSTYFWLQAVSHTKLYIDDDDDDDDDQYNENNGEDSNVWMQSLAWMDPYQQHDCIQDMRKTRAWSETMEIMQTQTLLGDSSSADARLSISYTAPVIVPVAILSTLHLIDSLRIQFDRLISTIACRDDSFDETLEPAFFDIMLLTSTRHEQGGAAAAATACTTNDQQRLAHWLAALGATVEALWKNRVEQAEKWLPTLIQRVPRSMTCKASSVSQKAVLNQLDELTKKTMIHVVVGAVLLKNADTEKQKQGLVELENAQVLRMAIRKLQSKTKSNSTSVEDDCDLESTVMALAEFVVSFIGLESWISAMKLDVSTEKEMLIDEEVRESTLLLRRMVRFPSLQQAVSGNQSIVDRLSRLGRFIAHHPGDADSACDLSDEEEDVEDDDADDDDADGGPDCDDGPDQDVANNNADKSQSTHLLMIKRSDKAQLILRGL